MTSEIKDREPHKLKGRQHDENETTKDLPHAKCQCRSTDTQTEPSHLEAVERLVKQYTHSSYAMASVYAQEIENVCGFIPDEKDNAFGDQSRKFSYKKPCCDLAGNLRTYLLQKVLCPSNVCTATSDSDVAAAQRGRGKYQSLLVIAICAFGMSSRNTTEQPFMLIFQGCTPDIFYLFFLLRLFNHIFMQFME